MLLNKKEYDKAIKDFTSCLEINKKDSNALNNRGLAYEKLNQNEKALDDYLAALEIEETAILFLNLGNLCKKENNKENAIKYYQNGINICNDDNIMEILKANLSTLQ